jgi:hypothetical protein
MKRSLSVIIFAALGSSMAFAGPDWGVRGVKTYGPPKPTAGLLDGTPSPIQDPKGDAQNSLGAGPPLLDIETIHLSHADGLLSFSMSFFTPIAAPSTGLPEGVVGVIELDTDRNIATGAPPVQNGFSPPFASLSLGADYLVLLFSEAINPGFVDIVDSSFNPVGTVPISFTPTSFAGDIPLGMLGGDDGIMDFTTIIGTVPQPTDAIDVVGTSVPEPATLAMLLAAAAIGLRRR